MVGWYLCDTSLPPGHNKSISLYVHRVILLTHDGNSAYNIKLIKLELIWLVCISKSTHYLILKWNLQPFSTNSPNVPSHKCWQWEKQWETGCSIDWIAIQQLKLTKEGKRNWNWNRVSFAPIGYLKPPFCYSVNAETIFLILCPTDSTLWTKTMGWKCPELSFKQSNE